MKERAYVTFALSAVLMIVACGRREQPAPLVSGIIVTNIVNTNQTIFNPTGGVSTVMLLTNGMHFGFEPDHKMISVDIPGHYGAWIYYSSNDKPRRMVHQFYGTNRYWLMDIDADGIPDTRTDYNEGPKRGSKSIFVKGDWIEADVRFTNATAVVEERAVKFQFANGKWTAGQRQ
jgi:hypothetical protein